MRVTRVMEQRQSETDTGLACLVMLLRFHGVGAEPEQIRHQFGGVKIGAEEMLRCAKDLGIKGRVRRTTWPKLATTPLPAIACLREQGFVLLGKTGDGKAIIQSPLSPRPTLLSREEFENIWDGRLVLMTRRASL